MYTVQLMCAWDVFGKKGGIGTIGMSKSVAKAIRMAQYKANKHPLAHGTPILRCITISLNNKIIFEDF